MILPIEKRESKMKINASYLKEYFFCILAITLILFSAPAIGATIYVPGDYPTIQAGIDAASDGDTVLVADGTYTGEGNKNLEFGGKAITVRSENGPDSCIIDCEGNGRGFYFHDGVEEEDSIVSGFTITNGYANNGGGIYCKSTSPTITDCIITGNTASGNTANDGGGGIYCKSSSPTITNCTISGNTAYQGGGILCLFHSSPTISNCTISENTASGDKGGGISCSDSSPIITDCTISNNVAAAHGGGIWCMSSSSPIITSCTISGNTASLDGGGISCFNRSSPIITNCTINANTASADGGGIYCSLSSSLSIINCTITENTANDNGGGIGCSDSSPTITNCILWNDFSDEIYVYSGSPNVRYSDIQGGYQGEGNIDADPLFIGSGDYHLTESSPCIDVGTSEGAPDDDIDGEPRPQGGGYDMGSDEAPDTIPTSETGGGTGNGGGGDGCFIATAAFGTPIAEEVVILRKFRDHVLLKDSAGRNFMKL